MRTGNMGRLFALVVSAGLAASACAQVTVLGEYSKRLDVTAQIITPDPNSQFFFVGDDRSTIEIRSRTEVVLSEMPTVGNTDVDVLSFRVTSLTVVFEDDMAIPLGDFGEPPVFTINTEGIAFELRDRAPTDVNVTPTGPGLFDVEYLSGVGQALGTISVDVLDVPDPLVFELRSFGDFDLGGVQATYEIAVENGEVVQKTGMPLVDIIFVGLDVNGAATNFTFTPVNIGDDFTVASPLIEPCDEAANPSGTFGGAGQFIPAGFDARNFELADADNDGDIDIVAAIGVGADDRLITLLNFGDGTFSDFIVPLGAPVDRNSSGLTLAHFNDDGIIDAAVIGTNDNGLEVLFGAGDGTFTLSQKFEDTTSSPIAGVAAADLNGDGAIDIVDSSRFGDAINVYLNDGTGQFAIDQTIPIGDLPLGIVLEDLNGDGATDIAVVSAGTDSIEILLNDGAAGFTPGASIPVLDPNSMRAGQLDGVGGIDFAVSSFTQDSVTVLLNNGDATFAPGASFPAGDGASGITLGDFDGDLDLDVALAANVDDAVSVLLNDGSGALGAPTLVPGVDGTAEIESADLDGDGDVEIVADQFSFSDPDGIKVFLNGCTESGPTPCSVADLALPFGITDLGDIDAFIAFFLVSASGADLVAPFGVVDLGDIDAFIAAFLAGCP
ncbi:MAG: VCBS repeat-containing protein [Planctomycetota bacterium]